MQDFPQTEDDLCRRAVHLLPLLICTPIITALRFTGPTESPAPNVAQIRPHNLTQAQVIRASYGQADQPFRFTQAAMLGGTMALSLVLLQLATLLPM